MDRCCNIALPLIVLILLIGAVTKLDGQQLRSPAAAAGLELVVPVSGHIYAGDAAPGILPAAASLGASLVFINGYTSCQRGIGGALFGAEPDLSGCILGALGAVAYIGTRVWGAASASSTATDRNRRLGEQAEIRLGVRSGGLAVGVWVATPGRAPARVAPLP